jgi:MoeA N-terminal region (domain I and II)
MASEEIPMWRLPAGAAVPLSPGASVHVHGPDSAHQRQSKGRQLFDPAYALRVFLDGVEALRGEDEAAICDTAGRIKARDIRSPVSLPRFDNSAMDGYGNSTPEISPQISSSLSRRATSRACGFGSRRLRW